MSTQQLLMPGDVIVHRNGRRIVVAASIVTALFAGALVGRSTAPTTPQQIAHPAALLTRIGDPSVGDVRRAEMFHAMNGLQPTATIQPAIRLDPKDVSSENSARLAEMFRAMNGLRHQQI